MNRRSFFGTLFGGLLCKFLPKGFFEPHYAPGTWGAIKRTQWVPFPNAVPPTRVDFVDMRYWGQGISAKLIKSQMEMRAQEKEWSDAILRYGAL